MGWWNVSSGTAPPSKCEALSLNPSIVKKIKIKNQKDHTWNDT
jgi:hypothetical protein